jgi:hypothetical protein
MKVVTLETKDQKIKKQDRDDFLEIIDTFRERFVKGEVNEFVIHV